MKVGMLREYDKSPKKDKALDTLLDAFNVL